jgi:UDP-N-acetyl-D-mannosaminuronic acid transferase (WecB/TagA/CpsF family)
MDAAFEHLTHLKSDSQTGDERARQRDAIIEYSNGSSSIALYVGLGSPRQAEYVLSNTLISMPHANQCSPCGDDKSQPLV